MPSVRFVGGHYDQPDLFDIECRVLQMGPTEIVLQPLDSGAPRITLSSRYVGKRIGSVDGPDTTRTCTYHFADDSHRGMATWLADENGGVTVSAHDY